MTFKGDWVAYVEKHADIAVKVSDWLPVSCKGDWVDCQAVWEAQMRFGG
jgi:hypothetical protein